MREIFASLIHLYESAPVVKKFRLTREEFIYLYLIAEGYDHAELMDYLDCQKDKLYKLRNRVIRKTRARNLYHAMVIYTQENFHKMKIKLD